MGGRGSSSGISESGKIYGTEYKSVYQYGNIKFLRKNTENLNDSVSLPLETMTKGRVYVGVDKDGGLTAIGYYDNLNKRVKQIDLKNTHKGKKPHTHLGYLHSENGERGLLNNERKLVDFIVKIWNNRIK
ncbi:MAG: hypothetical protein SPL05_06780 [Eubacteriales bacterium]|nr:hypothetical protein [Eubacteriales bacterium]